MEKLKNYLQTILDNAEESVWIINPAYQLIWFNQKFIKDGLANFGYVFEKGKNVLDVNANEATIAFWKRRYDGCLAGKTLHEIDTYLPLGMVLKVRMMPIWESDKIVGVLTFAVNIQETKEKDHALIHIKQEMDEQRRRQATFLHKISHELKTPLNAVLGLAHLLLSENPTPEQTENLEKIAQTLKHLAQITENALDVLDFSQKGFALPYQTFDIFELLQKLKIKFEARCAEKNIAFNLNIAQIPAQQEINSHEIAITQIIEALFENAFQHTHQGQIEVFAKVLPQEIQEYVIVQIKIQDTGTGIAPDMLTKIFETLFGTLPNHTTQPKGLLTVRQMLDKLGGYIELKSHLGEGTIFTIELPVKIAEKVTITQEKEIMPQPRSLMGLRVLFVEDNLLNQKWTGRFLQNWHIEVEYASNGRQAIEKVLQCPPDKFYHAILMDIQMPEIDGYEATKIIRTHTNIPILVLSATPPSEFKKEAKDLFIHDFIAKPFEPETLYQKLKTHTAYDWFVAPEKRPTKVLADFEAVEEFAEGDAEYRTEMFELYKKFFVEFIARFKEAVTNQDLKMLKALTHKARPSVKLMNLTTIEAELNRVLDILENSPQESIAHQITTHSLEQYCKLCLAHLQIYSPDNHES